MEQYINVVRRPCAIKIHAYIMIYIYDKNIIIIDEHNRTHIFRSPYVWVFVYDFVCVDERGVDINVNSITVDRAQVMHCRDGRAERRLRWAGAVKNNNTAWREKKTITRSRRRERTAYFRKIRARGRGIEHNNTGPALTAAAATPVSYMRTIRSDRHATRRPLSSIPL